VTVQMIYSQFIDHFRVECQSRHTPVLGHDKYAIGLKNPIILSHQIEVFFGSTTFFEAWKNDLDGVDLVIYDILQLITIFVISTIMFKIPMIS
ncbi:hypothetical protein HAX54_026637, partial [Datura stramonium]|nr:hypothetical protein [Datura stramonium]